MTMTVEELYEQVRDGRIISDIELQREIVYNTEKQELVIDSLVKGIPLPAFYLWRNDDGILEVLDGKQRIEAIKKFKQNDLAYKGEVWREALPPVQDIINKTELPIIICEGTEEKKREIFKRINTLGVPLSQFEVLNGLFNGEYLRGLSAFVASDKDALKVLGANSRGKNQMKVLQMIMALEKKTAKDIADHVKKHKDESFQADQIRLRRYLKFLVSVFEDFKKLDILFRLSVKYIKDVAIWKEYKKEINNRLKKFLKSSDAKLVEDVGKEMEDIIQAVVQGISVDDKRLFTIDDKKELLAKSECKDGKYKCAMCPHWFFPEELEVDHIIPWSKGGRTELSNAQLLCRTCNMKKGNRLSE